MRPYKIYLAGPDVFRKDSRKYLENLVNIVEASGNIGIAPIIELPNGLTKCEQSEFIFDLIVSKINEADVIMANMEPFRGPDVDSGTAFEMGYMFGHRKIVYGYSYLANFTLKEITTDTANTMFPIVEDLGNYANLMLAEAIKKSGGKIFKTLEECLINFNNNKP